MKSLKSYYISYFYILFLLASLVFSCAREESVIVKANFDIEVIDNDYSVPVKVKIINKTSGADSYEWTFEGAETSSSQEVNPQPIVYLKKGIYKIRLRAYNRDGNSDYKEKEIQIDDAMKVNFDWKIEGSDIAPVSLSMVNQSIGASTYLWSFENGQPATSTEKNPKVIFNIGGEHKIKLTISNGRETYSIEKTLTIKPAMVADFDWNVDFIHSDYQAPVILHLNNKSTQATSYEWIVSGAYSAQSSLKNPEITLPIAGDYKITLKASNDKETKSIQKEIKILPNKNLLSFKDIKLGINTAHESIGCFFSSHLGKVITKNEVNITNGSKIDLAFFGLDANFTYNQFVSPTEVQNTAFLTIPNATATKIINSQELVNVQLSSSDFDAIENGSSFNSINITESAKSSTPFTGKTTPRIILFQTKDGRKGAVKIKQFVSQGKQSYILTDIKVQKKP